MRPERAMVDRTSCDLLRSSETSSDMNGRKSNGNNINFISQNIQNVNNKITIIIKHNDYQAVLPELTPQVVYIKPAASNGPYPPTQVFSHMTNDLQNTEICNNLELENFDTEDNYQFYNERPIDVPEDFSHDTFLVLNLQNASHQRLRRRICTPKRNLLPVNDYECIRSIEGGNKINKAEPKVQLREVRN